MSFKRIFNLKVVCACAIFIASTDCWILRIITPCGISDWPSNWEHDGNGPTYGKTFYYCHARVESSGNLTSVVDVVGNHLEGKTNSDIQLLSINNSPTLTSIPSNIGNLFPNLIAFQIRAVQLTSVTAEDLKQFANLIQLAIFGCPIVSLDADLFKYTPNIQVLIMTSNKIENVGQDLLANLVDLKIVNFLSNPCLSYYASNPQMLEWLKNNLSLSCPPIQTTTSIQTTPTTTAPVEQCEIRCSLNAETDELKDQLIEQGALIRDLFEIVSNYSHRLFELEKFDAKVTSALGTFCH